MKIMSLFNSHQHYWGIPHARPEDNRLVQTCYECGAERKVKAELRPTFAKQTQINNAKAA
ncbi:MAG TPA: hypothetical protein VEZ90_16000 [Blastocatellia bacterium]|nr:hypothetical protein [Blastocatellia bacterium]